MDGSEVRSIEDLIFELEEANLEETAEELGKGDRLRSRVNASRCVNSCIGALKIRPAKIASFVGLLRCLFDQERDMSNVRHFLWANLTNAIRFMTDFSTGTLELRVLYLCNKAGVYGDKEILGFIWKLQQSVRTYYASLCLYIYFLNIIVRNVAEDSTWARIVLSGPIPDDLDPLCVLFSHNRVLVADNIDEDTLRIHAELASGSRSLDEVADAIRRDDCDTLQSISSMPGFDLNRRVESSLFEPVSVLQNRPTLAQFAAFFGAVKCFRFLNVNNADLERTDQKGRTVAQFTCYGGNTEILSMIDKKCSFANCLEAATRFHWDDVFMWLVEAKRLPVTAHECCVACEVDNEMVTSYCLDDSVDVNHSDERGETLLHIATINNALRVVKVLLAHPAIEINKKAERALDVMDSDGTPIHFAAMCDSISTLSLLLSDPRADVNVKDRYGDTPLHLAAESGSYLASKLLCRRQDIQVSLPNGDLWTPFHLAVNNGNIALMEYLYRKGHVDVNTRNKLDGTPLHWAILNRQIASTERLLSYEGVDVNVQDRTRSTPLHYAIIASSPKYVELLLDRQDLNPNIRDLEGNTPLILAVMRRQHEHFSMLIADPRVDPEIRNGQNMKAADFANSDERFTRPLAGDTMSCCVQ